MMRQGGLRFTIANFQFGSIVVLLLFAGISVVLGDIIIVDDDGSPDFNNIQAAIDDSNDGDVIIVLPGTYTGPGNRDISFGGRAITVRGVVPEDPYVVAHTIVDCNGSESDPHRGFWFGDEEGGSSVLSGITIRNGWAIDGGGIIIDHMSPSFPTIYNCVIENNFAQEDGGGIFYFSFFEPPVLLAAPQIIGCTIRNNSAGGNGGGIYGYHLSEWGWGYQSDPVVINCTISGNEASLNGGGLAGVFEASNCTITDNRAVVNGGGMWGCESPIRCSIIGNFAGQNGGGIGIAETFFLNSCLIVGNTATVNGGGVYSDPEWDEILINCTIGWNVAETGHGGGVYGEIWEITNCIFWNNRDSTGDILSGHTGDPSMENVYFSCIGDDDPNDANIPFGGGDNSNIDDYPVFVRDPNDGGDGWGVGGNDDFGDLHLLIGSPCINSGNTLGWIDPNFVDIDNQSRVMGHKIDIGADEFYMLMLITTKPVGGEVWAAGSEHEVLWDSYDYDGNVAIALSRNGGGNWELIESEIVDTGSYLWQLASDIDSNECVIKVTPSVVDPNVVCVASGLFRVHPDSPGTAVTSRWRSLGGDFERRGRSDLKGPEFGCVKWEFEVDGAISASVTVGPNDIIYVPCEDGNLYTLDSNGQVQWSFEANTPLISSASLGVDGTAYVGSMSGRVFAVDIDGNLRWSFATGGEVYSSPGISPDGNSVYVCSEDGKIYALGRDGSELWSFETGGSGVLDGAIFASPTIADDGTIYIGGLYDSNLYALEPNGSTKWTCHFDSDGWLFASPVIADDGTIYQSLLYDSYLYAIDPNDGSILWSTNLSDYWYDPRAGIFASYWFEPYSYDETTFFRSRECEMHYMEALHNVGTSGWSEPAVDSDGTIYVSLDDPWLRVVEPNGIIERVIQYGSESGFDLTVGSYDLVYGASDDSNLYVANPGGIEISRFDSNNYWLGFPVVSEGNTVLVGDSRDNSMLISYANNRVFAISNTGCEGQEPDLYWQGGPQDLNDDGFVDYLDIAVMAEEWLKCRSCRGYPDINYCWIFWTEKTFFPSDINRDRYVDGFDFALIAEKWLAGY